MTGVAVGVEKMPKIVPQPAQAHSPIYADRLDMNFERQGERLTQFCMWAERDFSPVEFLLPQIRVATTIEPFTFERRFASSGVTPPTDAELGEHYPWYYQVEFGPNSTLGSRRHDEWTYHRYRASLLVGLAAAIAGDKRGQLSVADIACHCGVFALEFAERGFGRVLGTDLREENIRQARYLAKRFGIPNTTFEVANARDTAKLPMHDIVFCIGLLYHVTFPMELMQSIYDRTTEFAIIDTIAQRHPFSGFHLVTGRVVGSALEGEAQHEFSPTYRGLIDAVHGAGFQEVYEIIGDRASEAPHYDTNTVRSLLAVKNRDGLFKAFREQASR